MATSTPSIGVIILGNSGAGKSFLGNVILGFEAFKHEFRIRAVTTKTEHREVSLNGRTYSIYNIPGLIEAKQERIDLNIREIDAAFHEHPHAVVLFVLGTNYGRPKPEDIVAFDAINKAYPLSQKSLVVVINGLDPNRPDDYDQEALVEITELFKMHLPYICFVNHAKRPDEKAQLRQQLTTQILAAVPKIHQKKEDIVIRAAEISKLTRQIAQFQAQIEEDREKHRVEMERLKKDFEAKEEQQRVQQQQREQQILAQLENQRRVQEEADRQNKAQQDQLRRLLQQQQQDAENERRRREQDEKRFLEQLEQQRKAHKEQQDKVQQEQSQRAIERQEEVQRQQNLLAAQIQQFADMQKRAKFSCFYGHALQYCDESGRRYGSSYFSCNICNGCFPGRSWHCGCSNFDMCENCARRMGHQGCQTS